jgi:hypothetical protein
MKIISAIKSGLSRSLRSWKGILIFWFISLIMVSFLIVPVRAGLNSVFGNSMVIEKLMNGINIDVLGDMGANLKSIYSSLFSGILILALAAILINVFITGGLFDALKSGSERFSSENFFSASAKKFWSFLIISAILYLIILFLILIVIVIPVSISANSESAPEGLVFKTFAYSFSVFLVIMPVVFLVADYARAWQAARLQNACFKALGFGFRQTFRSFFSSLGVMIIILILQALLGWGVISVIAGFTPVTGGGVFLLFIISQLLFAMKIILKTLRYGSVTSLMEQYNINAAKKAVDPIPRVTESPEDLQLNFKTETND